MNVLPASTGLRWQALVDEVVDEAGVELIVARLDQIDALAPGNKWFKLMPNVRQALAGGSRLVASFGGSYSNHIHALAGLGQELGLATVGFIRDTNAGQLTPTLEDARDWGMELRFLSRSDYRRRHDPEFCRQLLAGVEDVYWVPEGGSNALGVEGCRQIIPALAAAGIGDFDEILLAVGTGGTLAGVAATLEAHQSLIGIPVLKGEGFLERDIRQWLATMDCLGDSNWALDFRFYGKGYGQVSPELLAFMQWFDARHGIPLDPVYTGKLLFGLYQRLRAGEHRRGSRLVALHSGGLQGRRGVAELAAT